jgi:hypothetical protein
MVRARVRAHPDWQETSDEEADRYLKGSETIVPPSGQGLSIIRRCSSPSVTSSSALCCGSPDDAREREAEILVLRHQSTVLTGSNPRPCLRRRNRMVIAALANLMDRDRWNAFIVSPATISAAPRAVRRKWTFRHREAGRPPLDSALVLLIVQMARENPRWGVIRIKGELQGVGTGWARPRSARSFAAPSTGS